MSVEKFIREMPKVELDIRLEGALLEDRLLIIAEQNEIEDKLKHFKQWTKLLHEPDYSKVHELIQVVSKWLQQPEDLTHVVYELGVSLAKQNVRYAEVTLDPVNFTENGFTFETLLSALNDGRDRAERAWGVRMAWVMAIPRDNPRSADEIARWVTTAAARKAGVVGLGLVGKEDAQPVGQFERAFRTAEKKNVARIPASGEKLGVNGVAEVIEHLNPNRIVGGWGIVENADLLTTLHETRLPVNIALTGAVRMGLVESYSAYPLRELIDDGVMVTLTSAMASLYKTSITAEYLAAVEHLGLGLEELEEIALNAVLASELSPDEKNEMVAEFKQAYASLKAELLTDEAPQ